jgi:hypothetical protein
VSGIIYGCIFPVNHNILCISRWKKVGLLCKGCG